MSDEQHDFRNAASGEIEARGGQILFLLNRLPVNASALSAIDEQYRSPPIDNGLNIVRLIACLAREQGHDFDGCLDELAIDLRTIANMSADDAVGFMALWETAYGIDDVEQLLDDDVEEVFEMICECLPMHIRECLLVGRP